MNTQTENMQVINALVGKPVPWVGGDEADTEMVARMLRKRRDAASPAILARLTGLTGREVSKHLARLQRAGKARPVGNGAWVAA